MSILKLKFCQNLLQNTYGPIKLGPEEFVCPICGKVMTTYGNMVIHIRVHTGEKPFKCSICNYSTGDKSNYQRHMIQKHGYTKDNIIKFTYSWYNWNKIVYLADFEF